MQGSSRPASAEAPCRLSRYNPCRRLGSCDAERSDRGLAAALGTLVWIFQGVTGTDGLTYEPGQDGHSPEPAEPGYITCRLTSTDRVVSVLTMRSAGEDRTARAQIRDAALRLFASDGADRVPLRRIAAEAGVSHALVVHHFGSKEGLRAVVDAHVIQIFDAVLADVTGASGQDVLTADGSESAVSAMLERLPADSPVPAYVRRLLLDGGEPAQALFERLFALSVGGLDTMVRRGSAAPGQDAAVRAAFLLANDLAVLLLRDQLTAALGVDPLSPEGLRRWSAEVFAVYAEGLRGEGR
jgi:AcrR family transcriptional regulator